MLFQDPAMSVNRTPVFVTPGEGHLFADLNCRISSASTNGAYCAFEFTAPPGEAVPLHVHSREDELYYILEGVLEIDCGGNRFAAAAGAMAVLPRNIPHLFRNAGSVPARVLTIFIPGGFDDYVQELSRLSLEDAADESKRDAVRQKHGITMLR
jgi:mannose-6-phosphate isomerase-like protein (cupin superfamily)